MFKNFIMKAIKPFTSAADSSASKPETSSKKTGLEQQNGTPAPTSSTPPIKEEAKPETITPPAKEEVIGKPTEVGQEAEPSTPISIEESEIIASEVESVPSIAEKNTLNIKEEATSTAAAVQPEEATTNPAESQDGSAMAQEDLWQAPSAAKPRGLAIPSPSQAFDQDIESPYIPALEESRQETAGSPINGDQKEVTAETPALEEDSFLGDKSQAAPKALDNQWPSSLPPKIEELKNIVKSTNLTLSFAKLLERLGIDKNIDNSRILALTKLLAKNHILLEANLGLDRSLPTLADKAVLFYASPEDGSVEADSNYQAAAVTLGLAHAVATTDDKFCEKEEGFLNDKAARWPDLSVAQRKRLQAHLQLKKFYPASLSVYKRRLKPLELNPKSLHAIAKLLTHLAHADGVVDPREIKLLEKIYAALGLQQQLVETDLNDIASVERFEELIIEGEDPLEINLKIREQVLAL